MEKIVCHYQLRPKETKAFLFLTEVAQAASYIGNHHNFQDWDRLLSKKPTFAIYALIFYHLTIIPEIANTLSLKVTKQIIHDLRLAYCYASELSPKEIRNVWNMTDVSDLLEEANDTLIVFEWHAEPDDEPEIPQNAPGVPEQPYPIQGVGAVL